jgi:Sulfatase
MPTDDRGREVLPIPDQRPVGLVTYDAKDPDTSFPPIEPIRPPSGAPNVLVVLIDDVGFGASSAFGGPCQTPTAERLAAGGLKFTRFQFGGWSLYLVEGRPRYCYNLFGIQRFTVEGDRAVPDGTHRVRMEFAYDGGGLGKGGTATLFVDGNKTGEGRVEGTVPMLFSGDETADVGTDYASPVADDYPPGDTAFSGRNNWVQLDIGADDHDHLISPEERLRIAMTRQ